MHVRVHFSCWSSVHSHETLKFNPFHTLWINSTGLKDSQSKIKTTQLNKACIFPMWVLGIIHKYTQCSAVFNYMSAATNNNIKTIFSTLYSQLFSYQTVNENFILFNQLCLFKRCVSSIIYSYSHFICIESILVLQHIKHKGFSNAFWFCFKWNWDNTARRKRATDPCFVS